MNNLGNFMQLARVVAPLCPPEIVQRATPLVGVASCTSFSECVVIDRSNEENLQPLPAPSRSRVTDKSVDW
jgi:hypothetical protein